MGNWHCSPTRTGHNLRAQSAQETAGGRGVGGAAKHISIPQPHTVLHAARTQVFAVVRTEDFFLLIQKDTVLEPKQRTLLAAGMWPCQISFQKTERGNATTCRTGLSQHPTPLLPVGRKTSASSP